MTPQRKTFDALNGPKKRTAAPDQDKHDPGYGIPARAVVALAARAKAEEEAKQRKEGWGEAARSPLAPRDELRLDAIEEKYREWAQMGRTFGLDFAADNLERFIEGTGGNKDVSREEARSFSPISNAEEENQKRFENSLVADDHKYGQTLKDLEDGQSVRLSKDIWDVDLKAFGDTKRPARPGVMFGSPDLAAGSGDSDFKSTGNFIAKRKGDTIHIEGVVEHEWSDTYDWDKDQPYGAGAMELQVGRGAKPFDLRAGWRQRMKGTVRIEDGELKNPRLVWTDEN